MTVTRNPEVVALITLHGMKGQCPTCYETGQYDTLTQDGEVHAFVYGIWFNPTSMSWECHSCWVK